MRVGIISGRLGTKGNETSTLIADEAIRRNYNITVIDPESLSQTNKGLFAIGYQYPKGKKDIRINLGKDFDVIHFRPNPPVDMNYLTILYLLDQISDQVLITNNPKAIITLAEKIFPLQFSEFIPPTLITKNAAEISKFLALHKEIILKPLYEFGGNGVVKIDKKNSKQIDSIVKSSATPLIAQKFISKVVKGDKRILIINGKVMGGFHRVPKKGSYLANTVHGSAVVASNLSAKEQKFCKIIRPLLLKNDILTCGLDFIGGFLTEINITSVGGFNHIYNLYGTKPEKKLWDAIKAKLGH